MLVPGIAGVLTQSGDVHDGLDIVELEGVALARKPFVFKDFLVRLEMQLKSKVARYLVTLATLPFAQSGSAR